ncbi:hypothetical protein N9Y48_04220 [Zobellia sp.]|nr:hypothetical protein [Zobellia sp.]
MKKQIHLAAQYLAAAGISFLDKKEDDSHTNLGFNTDNGCLETHILSNNNDQLLLNYQDFSMVWQSNSGTQSFPLDGTTHKDVLQWLKKTSQDNLNKVYEYNLHYELPYSIDDSYTFKLNDASALKELMHLRILAQFSLEKINQTHGFDVSIRIWPHHFDTGIYTEISTTGNSVGLGLAIPDSVCDEHYLYASGYNTEGQISTSGLKELTKGFWSTEGYIGGVLVAEGISEKVAVQFFNEVIEQFKIQ